MPSSTRRRLSSRRAITAAAAFLFRVLSERPSFARPDGRQHGRRRFVSREMPCQGPFRGRRKGPATQSRCKPNGVPILPPIGVRSERAAARWVVLSLCLQASARERTRTSTGYAHWILNPARLPIPPLSQVFHSNGLSASLRPSCSTLTPARLIPRRKTPGEGKPNGGQPPPNLVHRQSLNCGFPSLHEIVAAGRKPSGQSAFGATGRLAPCRYYPQIKL